jgi:hypothetical protein
MYHLVIGELSGWNKVQHISDPSDGTPYNLEEKPLDIKTDSLPGSDDMVDLLFFDDGDPAGGLQIFFTDPPQYQIKHCTANNAEFDTAPPSVKDKIWRVTIVSRRKDIYKVKLRVHCNNEKVLDREVNRNSCSDGEREWSRKVTHIGFPVGSDTASDGYRAYKKPGYKSALKSRAN